MPPLTYFLISLLLTLAFVVAVDLIFTYLRRKARRIALTSEQEPKETEVDGSNG